MDDITVHKKSDAVLDIVKESGLKHKRKWEFQKEEIEFFGHQISKDGISPGPEKIKAIAKLLPPCNMSELCQFLGIVDYLTVFTRSFISFETSERFTQSKVCLGLGSSPGTRVCEGGTYVHNSSFGILTQTGIQCLVWM